MKRAVEDKTTCVEQYMIPEFISRNGTEPMTGELEELTCWENQVAMLALKWSVRNRRYISKA